MTKKRANGFLDACCRPSVDPESMKEMTDFEVTEILKLNSVGVLILIVAQIILRMLWELASIIPGFALYDGAPSTYSAYTHLGWWFIIDTLTLAIGLPSVYFALNYASDSGTLERGADRTITWLRVYGIVLAFAAIADVVHGGFSISEIFTCDSTLCAQYQWALILLIIVLFSRASLHIWNMYRVWVYRTHLKIALATERVDLGLSPQTAGATAAAAAPIKTALLEARTRYAKPGRQRV